MINKLPGSIVVSLRSILVGVGLPFLIITISSGLLSAQTTNSRSLPYIRIVGDKVFQDTAAIGLDAPNNLNKPVSTNLQKVIKKGAKTLSLISKIVTTNTNCEYKNGTVAVLAGNGIAPYQYKIDDYPWQNTGNFVNFSAGDHTVYVQDANGALESTVVTLTNTFTKPHLNDIADVNFVWGCTQDTGVFTLKSSGGTPPYAFSKDEINYQPSPTFTGLYPGIYAVSVKDANGCIDTYHYEVMGWVGCHYELAFSGGTAGCSNNDGLFDITLQGEAKPYYFSLDSIHWQDNGYFTGLSAGIKKVYVKNATNIPLILALPVVQYCSITTTVQVLSPACGDLNGSFILSTDFGTAPYTYSIDGFNYQSSNVFNNLAPGYYSIITKDAKGGQGYASAEILTGCPIIQAVATPTACNDNTGTVRAITSGGVLPYSFSLNGGLFQASAQFNNLASGNYTITVKDANGNKDSAKVVVTTGSCFTVTPVVTNADCGKSNGTILVRGVGGMLPYLYSLDGISYQTDSLFVNLTVAAYTVYLKDAMGAVTSSLANVANSSFPTVRLAVSTATCAGINSSITVTAANGVSPYLYSIDNNNFQSGNVFNSLRPGLFTVWVKDTKGCEASDTITVEQLPSPAVSLGKDTTICINGSLTLQVPFSNQYTYLWNDGSTGNKYLVHTTGDYFVKVTNQFRCSLSDTINIAAKQLPDFTLGKDTSICTGKVLQLHVLLTNANFQWSTGSTEPGIAVSKAGLYSVTVSHNGCDKTDSIVVVEKAAPVVQLGNDTTICEGNTILLNATGVAETYLWQDNSTIATYLVTKSGAYIINVNKDNCISADTINVNFIYKPDFTLGADQFICQGQQVALHPALNNQWQLQWQDGSNQPTYMVIQPGLYFLNASNTCGTSRKEILFTIGLCHVFVPNAFTPNGDSKNDLFKVAGTELVIDFKLIIYNRYGQPIFTTNDKNKPWDGTFKNRQVPQGNYVYLLQYKDNLNPGWQTLRGSCLLIR